MLVLVLVLVLVIDFFLTKPPHSTFHIPHFTFRIPHSAIFPLASPASCGKLPLGSG